MPTNDERREIAARLRKEANGYGFDIFVLADALRIDPENYNDGYHQDHESFCKDMWETLANLIEPEPERTCEFEPLIGGKKRCKRCGAFVSSDAVWDCFGVISARFCPNCGAKVVSE